MSNLTKTIIAFNRNKVITSLNTKEVPTGERKNLLIALTAELAEYGYILDDNAILQMSIEDMTAVHNEVLKELSDIYHNGEEFTCLYPGFPEEVLKLPEDTLKYYQTGIYDNLIDIDEFIKSSPWYTEEKLSSIAKRVNFSKPKVLTGMTEEEFLRIPISIMASGNSLQPGTRRELVWFLENYDDIRIPSVIPFKETQCIVMSLRDYTPRDINDVLRYAIYTMGGNPELVNVPQTIAVRWSKEKVAKNPEWRKLSTLTRSKRKQILSLINDIVNKKGMYNAVCDAKRFYGHWILLSERVHSGDYVSKYPEAAAFFKNLQTKELSKEFRTWQSKVQEMYDKNSDIVDIAKAISDRPGELVRRFDSLLRKAKAVGKESDVMDVFLETDGMKNKTLVELLSYYDRRNKISSRMVKPKNGVMKALPALEIIPKSLIEVIQEVIVRKILINIDSRITEKDLTGTTVCIDENLRNIPIPRDMKSRTTCVPAGKKEKLPDGANVIRFFVHWIQNAVPEDLDLHTMFLNENCSTTSRMGFNSNHKLETIAAFSGDVLNRTGNCAEYADIDINAALNAGSRYAVMMVDNYKGRGFDTLPCWLGYTVREEMTNGDKSWEPADVAYCQKISSTSTQIAAMVVDMKEREVIFLDTPTEMIPGIGGDIYENIAEYYTTPQTFTTYDVVKQHYISRGADVVDVIPDGVEALQISSEELSNDYVKVLEMIGE